MGNRPRRSRKVSNTFYHSGDLGDIIASLPSVRSLGGGDYLIGPGPCRESMRGTRFEILRPLLLAQPYIRSVQWQEGPSGATHDFSGFRHDMIEGENLADWQARHLGVTISLEPWLTANASPKSAGRVVVANSNRHRNSLFPWTKLLRVKYPDSLFVGLAEEHAAFQYRSGCRLEFLRTENLLELAEVIAGSKLFISNQSCPFWIAAGLGVNLIQEVWPAGQNSIVKTANAQYWFVPPEDFN